MSGGRHSDYNAFMDRQARSGNTPESIESVDERMIGAMRLLLALSALLVIYIDPSEPDRFVTVTYAALALYSLYSGLRYYGASTRRRVLPFGDSHWVDVASYRRGFRAGLSVAVVSAVAFTLVGFATALPEPPFEWNRFLLRPTYLLVLGYMIAYWGGNEIRLKRQLSLLREVTGLANPRLGVAHTLDSVMRRLRAFYDADGCLLVWSEARADGHYLMASRRADGDGPPRAEQV